MSKRIINISLVIILAISLPARGAPWDGNGTAEFPYLIYDTDEMQAIGGNSDYWSSHFKLMADIDLSAYTGTQFNMIGYYNHYKDEKVFRGQFDGNGHVIRNFNYSTTKSKVALFGYVGPEAVISNLGMENANVEGVWHVGVLAGDSTGTISNCYATGNVEGLSYVGVLLGENWGSILDCYAAGNVSGAGYVGGLAGSNVGVMSRCYSESSVSGDSVIGGLAGYNDYGIISDCYAMGNVTASEDFVGGLVGYNYGARVFYSYAAGSVTGNGNVGGLLGFKIDGYSAESVCISCFWDVDINPVLDGIGNTSDPNVVAESTLEMQKLATFISAGWDFTTPIWFIDEGIDYPRLWRERANSVPVANAGQDQTVFACADGMVKVKLDGSGSYDDNGDELEYFWLEGVEQIATGVDPNVLLGVGEHTIDLIVNDGIDDSEPNAVVVTVIGPVELDVHIVPRVINRSNHMKRVMAIIRLPEGVTRHDIADEPFVLEPGGIEASWQRVIGRDRVFALFSKDELMDAVEGVGRVELTVVGKLESGQCISGTDTVRIVQPRRRRIRGLRR
ncbi:MAG: GLUG motif-containing protein [Planctomycetota bacterium]|jgi:hypothetical protein